MTKKGIARSGSDKANDTFVIASLNAKGVQAWQSPFVITQPVSLFLLKKIARAPVGSPRIMGIGF
jgi:hypothetical protein